MFDDELMATSRRLLEMLSTLCRSEGPRGALTAISNYSAHGLMQKLTFWASIQSELATGEVVLTVEETDRFMRDTLVSLGAAVAVAHVAFQDAG